jgi:hypothetical protein
LSKSNLSIIYQLTLGFSLEKHTIILELRDDWDGINTLLHIFPIAISDDNWFLATPQLKKIKEVSCKDFNTQTFHEYLSADSIIKSFIQSLAKINPKFKISF